MLPYLLLGLLTATAFADLTWKTDNGITFSKISAAELKSAFKQWQKDFNKEYSSPISEARHFMQFVDNWKFVVDWNTNSSETYQLGLNQFADLNSEEFKMYIHGHAGSCFRQNSIRRKLSDSSSSSSSGQQQQQQKQNKKIKAPTEVDWTTKGVVTPVKNQGQCGSCWAFSTTGSIECRTAIATGKLVSLSEQELVDCSRAEGNQGCQGGFMDDGFKYVEKTGGLCTEQEYPYKAKNGICKASICGTKVDPIRSYTDVTSNSATSLEDAVAQGCVSIAIEADQQAFQFYKSGILSGRCGTRLDHGVLVVGYGSEGGQKFWKVKNSWGTSWGEKGYVRMCRECHKDLGHGECGILEQPSYPVV